MTSCFVQQSVGQNGKVSHLLASMLARQAIHQNIVDMLGSISSLVCSAASCRACSAQLASPTTAMRLLALRSARGRHLASFRSASKSFTARLHSFFPFPFSFVRSNIAPVAPVATAWCFTSRAPPYVARISVVRQWANKKSRDGFPNCTVGPFSTWRLHVAHEQHVRRTLTPTHTITAYSVVEMSYVCAYSSVQL